MNRTPLASCILPNRGAAFVEVDEAGGLTVQLELLDADVPDDGGADWRNCSSLAEDAIFVAAD